MSAVILRHRDRAVGRARNDELGEVVKVLSLDTAGQSQAVEVLSRTESHLVDVVRLSSHELDELDSGSLVVQLVQGSLIPDVRVKEVAHLLLKSPVRIIVVRRVVALGQPAWLGIRDGTECAELGNDDLRLLFLDLCAETTQRNKARSTLRTEQYSRRRGQVSLQYRSEASPCTSRGGWPCAARRRPKDRMYVSQNPISEHLLRERTSVQSLPATVVS